ncbi:antitoxin VbhA family protein, partial [Bacillus sp. 1735sda2]|uniref:antitoxin VbhA family protein n=2 Tax=Bacilli TaxID=91061 RepID=UPI0020A1C939
KGGPMMKMTKSEFEKGMKYAKATHAIEGIYLTAEEEELIWEHVSGQITDEEYERKALELAYKVI